MTERQPRWHRHTGSDAEIFGIQLGPGDTIEPDDVFNSASGKWIASPCSGTRLMPGCLIYWVRPVKRTGNQQGGKDEEFQG